jgi:hypothetical protein
MKNLIYFFAVILSFYSCQPAAEPIQEPENNPVNETKDGEWLLNDLLNFADMNAVKEKFGEKNAIIDTLWGPEGMFAIGTKLFPGTRNEVEIMWSDTLKYAGMFQVLTYARHDQETYELIFDSQWKTREGVYLGMPLEELVKLNGKPVKFLGFDWDYGGGVVSFENGVLEASNLSIGLSYDMEPEAINESGFASIIGDTEITTENNDLSEFKIKVVRLGVYRP